MAEDVKIPVAEVATIPGDVQRSLSSLLHRCWKCQGYGIKPPLAYEWLPDDPYNCPVCTPLRKWIYKTFGVSFEYLT